MVSASKLIYKAVPSPCALRDLDKLDLVGRDPRLPDVYVYIGRSLHPGRQHQANSQKTFIVFVDPSKDGKSLALKIAETLRIPYGRKEVMKHNEPGLLELFPGDFVFAWEVDSGGDPIDDYLYGFVGYRYHDEESQSKLERLDRARHEVLGSREVRTSDKIFFEQSRRAKMVRPPGRCYGIGEMVEQPPATEAPPAAAKVFEGTLDAHQVMQKELLSSLANFTVSTFTRQAPLALQECLCDFHELINALTVGCNENRFWPSWQLNVAPAQEAKKEDSLAQAMGISGDAHTDNHDSPAGYSCMTVLSDLPEKEGWEPGRFHLLTLGVYVTLAPFTTVFFTGRLRHGGTAPLQPPHDDEPLPAWAYRLVAIGYPARRIIEGDVRHALAALPFQQDPLYLTQEMTGVSSGQASPIYVNRSNIAMDGIMTMDRRSHFEFFTRALLFLVIFLLRQLPSQYEIHIDPDLFLDSITMHQDDEVVRGRPWRLAPRGGLNNMDNQQSNDPREQARNSFLNEHYPRAARAIPGASTPPSVASALAISRPRVAKRSVQDMTAMKTKKRRLTRGTPNQDSVASSSSHAIPIGQQSLVWLDQADSMLVHSPREEGQSPRPRADRETSGSINNLGESLNESFLRSPPSPITTAPSCRTLSPRSHSRRHSASTNVPDRSSQIDQRSRSVINRTTVLRTEGRTEECTEEETELQDSVPSRNDDCSDVETNHASSLDAQRLEFLSAFSATNLRYELEAVSNLHKNLPFVAPSAIIKALDYLDDVDYAATPLAPTADKAVTFLSAIGTLRKYGEASHVWRNASRQRVMFSEFYAYTHVTGFIRQECLRIATAYLQLSNSQHVDTDWLSRLTVRVADCVSTGNPVTLLSSDYFPTSLLSPTSYTESNPPRNGLRSFLQPADAASKTTCIIMDALCEWYNIPSDFKSQARAAFVTELLTKLGSGALLLSSTWKVYDTVPRWLFDDGSKVGRKGKGKRAIAFSDSSIEGFRLALAGSPVADRSSEAAKLLDHLRVAYRALLESARRYPIYAAPDSPSTTSLDPPTAFKGINQTSHTLPLSDNQSSIRTSPSHLMATFLREALKVAEDNPPPQLSRLQLEMLTALDFYMPLREIAPSRRLANQEIDAAFGASRQGLFSLLVFCNILFNTEALRVAPPNLRRVRFDNLKDFESHKRCLQKQFPGKSANFFCNRRALGHQTQTERKISNASLFWKASGEISWEEKNLAESLLDFVPAMKLVQKELKTCFDLPAFGLLGQYLLVADMCAAGLVLKPTIEEMGRVVRDLDAGGLEGLRRLGYIPNKNTRPPLKEVQNAFRSFYSDVEEEITTQEKHRMGWDPITAEHSLCKLTRVLKKGFLAELS